MVPPLNVFKEMAVYECTVKRPCKDGPPPLLRPDRRSTPPLWSLYWWMHFGWGTLPKVHRSLFHLLTELSPYFFSMFSATVTMSLSFQRTSNFSLWVSTSEVPRGNFMKSFYGLNGVSNRRFRFTVPELPYPIFVIQLRSMSKGKRLS